MTDRIDALDVDRCPNLFVVGAAKSGTTSLHHYLGQHDDIFMSSVKEPAFFVEERVSYPKDPEWYMGLFSDGLGARYRGESSPHYTMQPEHTGVAQRMARACPDARILYIMRDPVERAISHYWQRARNWAEHRPLLEALERNPVYRSCSDYGRQLTPYLEHFGGENVWTGTFESMVEDPSTFVRRVIEWLGLPPEDLARANGGAFEARNVTPEVVEKARGRGLLSRFRFTGLWERLASLVPTKLRSRARDFAVERVDPDTYSRDEAVRELRPWARERVAELSALLERDFAEWTTTLGETHPAP